MRRRATIVAILSAPLFLGACGGGSSTPAASATAAASSSAASSPSPTPGQTVDKDAFLTALAASQKSVTTYSMDLTMDVTSAEGSGVITAKGVADVSNPASPKLKLDMTIPARAGSQGGQVVMIMADTAFYMQMPGAGGKYLKVSAADMQKSGGQDITKSMDPVKQLEASKAAITGVTFVGEEDVSGTKSRHYRMVMDLKAALEVSGSTAPDGADLSKTIPMDLWVDAEGRTRKMTMDMAVSATNSTKMTTLMSKFGEPVSIVVPAPSEVMDLPTGGTTTSS